jgi:hypothetical protein
MPMLTLPPLPPLARASHPKVLAGLCALVLAAFAAVALWAQVAGERGITPVASTTDIEVMDVEVNTTGETPEEARRAGWAEAQRLAWKKIGGPDLPDSQLDGLVSAIIVQREQLGRRRYIATLGVVFDRARAGGLLGGGGERSRSAPMLTLPVLVSGGTQTMFEVRNPWQRAWAEFQTGASAIDYVRPTGSGWQSLLLTYGQTGRRSRTWWNEILDQFSAADVLIPIAELRHEWPGGPVEGRFTARYGPDDRALGSFTLRAASAAELPAMLTRAVRQFDAIYTRALVAGQLRPDPTLTLEEIELSPEVLALIEASRRAEEAQAAARAAAAPPVTLPTPAATPAPTASPTPEEAQPVSSFTVQVNTANAAAIDAALAAVRGTPGVRNVTTNSIAIGGTSVLRVSFAGDIAALAEALRARGWQVAQGADALAISR